MAFNVNEELEKIHEAITKLSPEEYAYFFSSDPKPKGWISIEEHLPMFMAKDIEQGYSSYLVKDKDGNKFETQVSDHNTWYVLVAKPNGITHWLNK